MKRNAFGFFALFLAVAIVTFSAFTRVSFKLNKDDAPSKYVTYDGSGSQRDISNYNPLSTAPTSAPAACDNSARLCWFRVDDFDHDNDIDASDFTGCFDDLDDGDLTLDDESQITGQLEKVGL